MEFIRIEAGLMVGGPGNTAIKNAALLIRGGRIIEAGPATSVSHPSSAKAIAFHDCTLLPGLIDCHSHLTMYGDGTSVEAIGVENEGSIIANAYENAQLCLENGVTTIADCGAPARSMIEFRNICRKHSVVAPRLFICGRALTVTGGHAWPFGGEVTGAVEARRAVRELMKERVDFIKVMVSGGSTCSTRRSQLSFRPDELAAVVDEAHRWGRLVQAHATCVPAILACLDADVDVIAHATFYEMSHHRVTWASASGNDNTYGEYAFKPEVAERIANQSVPVVPTLWTNKIHVTKLEEKGNLVDKEIQELDHRRRVYRERVANFQGLVGCGVLMAAGSDAGWGPPFGTFHEELIAMAEAGLGAAGAVRSATRDAARTLGIDSEVGSLEPNKLADFILVDGDPTRDIKALRNVVAVFIDGKHTLSHRC